MKRVKKDAQITMRIDKETLDAFKEVCGTHYQYKIRALMRQYINQINGEMEKRNRFLDIKEPLELKEDDE